MCLALDSLLTFPLSLLSFEATGYDDPDGYLAQVFISYLNFSPLSASLLIFQTPSSCGLREILPTLNSQSWIHGPRCHGMFFPSCGEVNHCYGKIEVRAALLSKRLVLPTPKRPPSTR